MTITSGLKGSRRLSAALAGVVAALVALAVGELMAGLITGGRSPVVAVGEVVIDNTPKWAKDFAIDNFGTNDKKALVVGILVILFVIACVIGLVAARRLWLGVVGIALFGVVGALAGVDDIQAPSWVAATFPAIIGAGAGIVALRLLRRVPGSPIGDPEPTGGRVVDRRTFLVMSGLVGVAAAGLGAAGRQLQNRGAAIASRAAVALPRPAAPLAPVLSGVEVGVEGVSRFITPNRDFYRIDTALVAPQVTADGWTLEVTGMVERELELTYDELLGRPDVMEADITMACVSNEVGGSLVGNARWLGVPLANVLREAGVQAGATQIVPRSVDGFEAGFPTETALDGRTALIAFGMNGEPLPIDHGFPARLVVPGLYGYVSATKWLKELELTTLEAFNSYWVRPGRGWAKLAPVKTQCRMDVPRGLSTLAPGPVAVAGVAWAPTRGITKVEVQIDDEPWREARLGAEQASTTWRQWVLDWQATPGVHTLRARATDGTGTTQPEERRPPIPDGAQGWPTKTLTISG